MAPECLIRKAYNMNADVYSFAVVLWEILTGKTPYGFVKGRYSLIHQIVEDNVWPTIDESWPSSIQGLLQQSFDSDIGMRPDSSLASSKCPLWQYSHTHPPLLIIKKMALWFDIIGEELACLRGGDYSRVTSPFISCRRTVESMHWCPIWTKDIKAVESMRSSCVGSGSSCKYANDSITQRNVMHSNSFCWDFVLM